jgi:S1-C subfamily serine protease
LGGPLLNIRGEDGINTAIISNIGRRATSARFAVPINSVATCATSPGQDRPQGIGVRSTGPA